MELFEETGFEVHEDEAFELFRKRGADVDTESRIVRVKEALFKDIIASVQSKITLYGRGEGKKLELGGDQVYFGTGGTALHVLDYPSEIRRPADLADLVDVIRISDRMENIDLMLLPTYPNEIPVEEVDINRFAAGMLHTNKHIMGGVYTRQGIRDTIRMAEELAGSPEELRKRPFISLITCGISPLRLDAKYGSYMLQIAREGLPLAVPAEPLCGATAPVTLAGTVLIQNCDALINVMATQLVNPGAPVMYGCVASSANFQDLNYLGGPVESGMINAATAQMTQYYGIPYYATAGISDSKVLDVQCGYETTVNNLLVGLSGADFIHDAAGLMEFALVVSKEKLVIDNEILGMVRRSVKGIEVNDDTLAVDLIKDVGPGGNFVSCRHTRRYMRKEHYPARLTNRDKREFWELSGKQTALDRAHATVEEIKNSPFKLYVEQGKADRFFADFPSLRREIFDGSRPAENNGGR